MKTLLAIAFVIFAANCFAQQSDFILFKHKERTVQTFFTGGQIKFTSTNGAYIEANILSIKNDSLHLQQYITRPVMTALGYYVLDTSFYYSTYHYNQILSIGRSGRRFDWGGSGGALMGGGLLLAVGSGVVYLADNKKFSPELLAASVGLFGVGYLLSRSAGKGMQIGKKYSLVYIKAAEEKKE